MSNMSSYTTRIKAIRDMKELAASGIDAVKTPELARYADSYIDYLSRPHEEFGRFRSGMFLYYLGGNVKSAAINATQPITTTLPWLSQYAGTASIGREMVRAQKDILNAIRMRPNGIPEIKIDMLPLDVRDQVKTALSEGIISEQIGRAHV